MRLLWLLFVASIPLTSGCSVFIAEMGKDLSVLKTRDDVHAAFGDPVAIGTADGKPFEEYHTRRKISDYERLGEGYCMLWAATFGGIELLCLPHELYLQGRRTVLGQTLRFRFDAHGTVTGATLDGQELEEVMMDSTLPAAEDDADPQKK